MPKGQGWKSLIRFTHSHLSEIGIENINFILPIIHDWNNKFRAGETTRYAGLIALRYYQWTIRESIYLSRGDTKDNLIITILYGSPEIESELNEIFEDVLRNGWKKHNDPYHGLSKAILTKIEGTSVCKVLPSHILKLADLFWSYTPRKDSRFGRASMGVEQYFGMEDDHDYFPASPYQTPMFWLLQSSLAETIDFILNFTNKVVEHFARSDFAKYEVEEIDVFDSKGNSSKQFICNRLWCTYRGTQVSPHALESIHMALEKFFLERGKHIGSEILESWLLYLLNKSKSASISAVVTSIVLAHPDKTFNVAKVLFKTKEYFHFDLARMTLDQQQKSSLSMLKNSFGSIPKNVVHESDRLKACDDKHRKSSLEHQFLSYQMFRDEGVSEQEAKDRQEALWEILDNYYEELPKESEQTEADKTWRLFLARMDRRKMKPTTEKTDEGILLELNPEIEQNLKEFSKNSLIEINKPFKYSRLMLWASYKLKNDDKCKQFDEYEDNPKSALKDTRKVIRELKKTNNDSLLFNRSIPGDVCSVLVKDYFESLSKKEKEFCKDILIEYASQFLQPNYTYQVSDGSQSAISVLSLLLLEFPKDKEDIKILLLLALFNEYPVDMAETKFNAFSMIAIQDLWESSFEDAQSLLLGYLLLKPKHEALIQIVRQENYEKNIYDLNESEILERFLKENEGDFSKLVENDISIDNLADTERLELHILKTAFQIIPVKTKSKDHKKIVKLIILAFTEKLLSKDRDDEVDYTVKHSFLQKLAYFVLNSPNEEIQEYLQPFIDNFSNSESMADLFQEFISAEDRLDSYEAFWCVWGLFEDKVVGICKNGDSSWYTSKVVRGYLFAQNPWKDSAYEWHTLKDENRRFFKRMSTKIGHCPSALYAISKLLNDIGSSYLDDGLPWISGMLENNGNLLSAELETNTIYYLENLTRKYIYKNRQKVKRTKKLKDKVLTILNYLVEKGSVVGYILRESIL